MRSKRVNLPRIYLLAILLLALGAGAEGQEPPKAVLVDEWGLFPCSELRGAIDHFLEDLAAKPETVGFVVTTRDESNLVGAVIREELIRAHIKIRRFDLSRIKFLRTVQTGGIKTQFWRMPNSTIQPEIPNIDKSYTLRTIVEPKLLLEDANYNDSECQDLDYPEIFARFLRDNPKARTNIVVWGATVAEAKRREKRTISSLVNKFAIDRKRIRTFLKVERKDPSNPKAAEFWILP